MTKVKKFAFAATIVIVSKVYSYVVSILIDADIEIGVAGAAQLAKGQLDGERGIIGNARIIRDRERAPKGGLRIRQGCL